MTLVVLFSGLLPFLDRLSAKWASLVPMKQAQGIIFCLGVALIFSLASALVTCALARRRARCWR